MSLPHHSLVAWQRADDLFLYVHKLADECFPTHERFVLTSQTRRAALSVALNIVEGCARYHAAERLQFLRTSWASLAELGYCLHVAKRLGYLSPQRYNDAELALRHVAAPLKGLIARWQVRVPSRTRS
jgi:four helix bundle protein